MACTDPVHALLDQLGDNLASRGRNPDMVNTINPADCNPGEVYEGTVHGVERTVLIRRDASDSYPWESLGEVLDHEDVSDLVRLVPAREVTRDDLPDFGAMGSVMARWKVSYGAVSDVLDAVVAHLNANGGLPASSGVLSSAADCVLESAERVKVAESDRDRWRRAHAIVEQERDQARESLREACKVAQSYKVDAYQATERAEAAEARTAPAVTREEVEKAIHGVYAAHGNWAVTDEMADAVCALFGVEAEPADPVEAKARELWEIARAEGSPEWGKTSEWVEKGFTALAAHVLGQEADQ